MCIGTQKNFAFCLWYVSIGLKLLIKRNSENDQLQQSCDAYFNMQRQKHPERGHNVKQNAAAVAFYSS